jgi:hypothetical protein
LDLPAGIWAVRASPPVVGIVGRALSQASVCLKCGAAMAVTQSEQENPNYDKHTLKCLACDESLAEKVRRALGEEIAARL